MSCVSILAILPDVMQLLRLVPRVWRWCKILALDMLWIDFVIVIVVVDGEQRLPIRNMPRPCALRDVLY